METNQINSGGNETVSRWCYRCADCLTVGFGEEELRDFRDKAQCGACGGQIENMGRVERDRLKRDAHVCACDGRCTAARGPSCDCHCGGKNHGTHAMVKITRDVGAVPRVMMRLTSDCERVAAEWRAAVAAVTAEIVAINARRDAVRWLSDSEFSRLYTLRATLKKARGLRTHAARMRALTGLAVRPTEVAA